MPDPDARSGEAFPAARGLRGRIGLVLGPAAFAAALALGAPAGMTPEAWRTAALALLMAAWWVTEAVPLPATALLPLALLPLLDVAPVESAAAPYAHPLVFLFLGGFLLAAAIERCGLHRRIALGLLERLGGRMDGVVAGFLASAALLSMWISNTATTLLLLPIGLSVVRLEGEREGTGFAPALLLAIAFGASIGGIGTLVGTPPNALTAAFVEESLGVRIGFARWMALGLPLVAVALPVTWVVLTRIAFRVPAAPTGGGREAIARAVADLGPVDRGERTVAAVFALTALAWTFRPLLARLVPGLTDTGIAVLAGLALFLLPIGHGRRALDWASARAIPWGVLVLFGGGLSLAGAIDASGLGAALAAAFEGLAGWPPTAFLLAVVLATILFSELASNTATAAAFLPVVGALAVTAGVDPLGAIVPAGLAASGGFMLPVATPPNAIVYGSGAITMPQLVRAGGLLDLLFAILVPLAALTLVPALLG